MIKQISFLIAAFLQGAMLHAQYIGWQQKDGVIDSAYGISSERAYAALLKNKKPKGIIVAIIDSGIDTAHSDLQSVLWTDSKTGIHGWNYIGTETGKEDVTLLATERKAFYDSLSYTLVPEAYREGYRQHRMAVPALNDKISAMRSLLQELDAQENDNVTEAIQKVQFHLDHGLNTRNAEEDTAKGDANINPDKMIAVKNLNYTPFHGTHVAGIIAGTKYGVVKNVQIMMLKTNGNIRELRDRSLARAIRFAVDHGASIINCSFGKPYTWAKKEVDEAIAYARVKDVLILHAAGNNADNNDILPNYPDPEDRSNWIVVGASDIKGNPADFSNYGKKDVDVFAPGVDIYSTIPGSRYAIESGTSMAAPMAASVAAMLRGYFPRLTAVQVKEIMVKSVVKRGSLEDKCSSGGIVNAYNAVKLAEEYK